MCIESSELFNSNFYISFYINSRNSFIIRKSGYSYHTIYNMLKLVKLHLNKSNYRLTFYRCTIIINYRNNFKSMFVITRFRVFISRNLLKSNNQCRNRITSIFKSRFLLSFRINFRSFMFFYSYIIYSNTTKISYCRFRFHSKTTFYFFIFKYNHRT